MHDRKYIGWIILCFLCFFLVSPSLGQYREYYIYGKIVDSENKPLEVVGLDFRDTLSSRRYKIQTDKKGEYKLIGVPHGIYSVTITKDGYRTQNLEWDFSAPQDRMQKIEMQTIVMVSEEKIQQIERAKQAQEEFNEAREKIGQADFDGAIEILKKMIVDNPADANAHYLLGISYQRKKLFPEAIVEFEKTAELSPSFAGVYHQLGLIYQEQQEWIKALDFYGKAIELEPKSVESFYNRGLILFEQNRVEESLVEFEKALEVKPDDPEFLEMAGRCYIHQADFKKAIEYLEKAKLNSSDQTKIEFLDDLVSKLREQIKK
jgi:tetratricopeptide (TPR) repeat protein